MKKIIFLLLMLFSIFGFAADQVVTNNNNSGTGSLRQAIIDAGDDDEITFNLSSGNETITLSSELSITESLTIDGSNDAGSGVNVTLQVTTPGTSTFRVFNINASGKTITLSNMTIKGGNISANGEVVSGYGGGIYISAGTVTIDKITLSSSKAYCGGGIYNDGSTAIITSSTIYDNQIYYHEGVAVEVYGGGIYSSGNTTILNSTITGNTIDVDAGGGESAFAYGAGICNEGTMYIVNSTISGNSATTAGVDTEAQGGGIYDGYITRLLNSIIVDNELIADSEDGVDISGSPTGYYCWCPDVISGSNNNTASYSSDLNAIAYNGGFTNTASVTSGANTSSKAGNGTYAYYNETDGYYFYNGSNYTKISDGSTFTPSDPGSDKVETDQRGYYRIDGTVHEGTTPTSVTSDITRGAYQYYGIVVREGGTWASGGDYYTHIKGAAERETSGTINLAGTAIYEYEIQLDDSETLTIQGEGASSTIVQADKTPGTGSKLVFDIRAGTITIADLTIRNGVNTNTYGIGGGGIFAMSCTINLNRVEITNCRTTNFYGGGFYFGNAVGNITGCTIRGNTSALAGGGGFFYVSTTGTLTITNSTICNNQAQGYGALNISGTSSIKFSTIVSNIATDDLYTGGIYLSGNLTMSNTILANNLSNGSGNDFQYQSGTITDNGYNIVENSNAYTWTGTGDITGEQANLFGTGQATQTLADNGGSTLTLALETGSVALAAGNWDADIATDQRGTARHQYNPSIGAYEPLNYNQSWTGSTSSNWEETGNWSPCAIPTMNDDITIPDVVTKASDPAIGVNDTATVHDLTVESGGLLTVQSDAINTGSLIVSGTATGDVVFERYATATKWHYVFSPVDGVSLSSWIPSNDIAQVEGQYHFYRWDEDTDYWIYYNYEGSEPENFGDTEFVDARGYALRKNTDGDLSFSGTPITSNVDYTASYTTGQEGGIGFHLVGNPYTSALGITSSASSTGNFLGVNTALLDDSYEAVFVWVEGSSYAYGDNDYRVISNSGISGYTSLSQDYVQPGQAFMVKVGSSGTLQFTTDMQYHADVDFYKEDEMWPSFELAVSGNEHSNVMAVGFHEGMSKGLDPSYDVGKMKGNVDLSIYSRLIDDNEKNFIIQTLPYFEEDYSVPVGLDITQTGTYTFEAVTMEQIPEDVHVYLEDLKTGTLTDLKETNTYTCVLDEPGSITDRFMLHFTLTPFGQDELGANNSSIQVWGSENTINVYNPEGKIGKISVVNMMGQSLITKRLTGSIKQSLNLQSPSGFYIVRINSEEKIISKKVIIE